MLPPWKAFPEIQPSSIGWRMGSGEAYLLEFEAWFACQQDPFRKRFSEQYPEPAEWRGFYR